MQTVAVIDYGMGNLHSAAKALEHVAPEGMKVLITSDSKVIHNADRVVLPGVGAIRDCMAEIRRLGVDEMVKDVVKNKPLLGICVGMQVLLAHSEENSGVECMGLLPGNVRYFGRDLHEDGEHLKVPHMGWSRVAQSDHPLWNDIEDGSRFYFVHSYYAQCEDRSLVAGTCQYGVRLDAALTRDNLFAVQFHPEKSAACGLKLLGNFLRWNP
ncbi:imidazole glycerol phosphate synthase subunit HisH [Sansalvadorimonas sp. 2012CJ34-2]|uniref:Imidazole glycerol phosphate synthase subunit HisH n=1 Tax=Parendozoicomonas callyspongiae TaxID=2942213 RepID=A0ABT0PE49_9GAMM|nr:imidazole glycerol phosphate synthase subunit HisH [Sansalvadorimonas sp. 2012CJ34-2]MCL6269637.1 imidazole glycerol phosphate synthase subunit HisH [Sansalvadorimonas sp. 2012CJ34-2]